MKTKIIIGVFIWFLLVAANCFAASYYVSNNGNDNNNGQSESSPFKSLFKVNQTLSKGDTVYLKRGDTWTVTHSKENGEGVGDGLYIKVNNITVDAYGTGNKPVIDAAARTDRGDQAKGTQYYSPVQVGVRYGAAPTGVTIQNLSLKGPAKGAALAAYNSGNGLTVSSCDMKGAGYEAEALMNISGSNHIIQDCFFDQITGNSKGYSKSIELRGGSGHKIRRNKFYGFASGGALRFSDHGTGATIERNFFYHPDTRDDMAWALVIRSGNGGTYIVRNNVFDLTGSSGMSNDDLTGGRFWFDYKPTTRKIYNNTFISDGKGYGLKGHGDTAYVYNNIFYNLHTAYDNGGGAKLRDNIFWSCDKKYDDSPGLEQGSSTANPEIKNPSMSNNMANDASLTNDSIQAINSGYENDSAIPSNDFNGYERVNTDIGAFEYTDASTSNTPSPPTNLTIISSN